MNLSSHMTSALSSRAIKLSHLRMCWSWPRDSVMLFIDFCNNVSKKHLLLITWGIAILLTRYLYSRHLRPMQVCFICYCFHSLSNDGSSLELWQIMVDSAGFWADNTIAHNGWLRLAAWSCTHTHVHTATLFHIPPPNCKMGKSAKFYKRPTRKEKESRTLNKVADPASSVQKKTKQKSEKKKEIVTTATAAMEVDPPVMKKVKKDPKDNDKPDYVDLFSGKKTYKKVPPKRK